MLFIVGSNQVIHLYIFRSSRKLMCRRSGTDKHRKFYSLFHNSNDRPKHMGRNHDGDAFMKGVSNDGSSSCTYLR